jgi:hypothetical protein
MSAPRDLRLRRRITRSIVHFDMAGTKHFELPFDGIPHLLPTLNQLTGGHGYDSSEP